MAGFRINYEQVVGQANTINSLSDDLDREIQKMENMLDTIGVNWKGPASTAYQNHLKILIADLRKTKYSMSSVSSTIKNVAIKIQQEDERQAELARQLEAAKAAEQARIAEQAKSDAAKTTASKNVTTKSSNKKKK